MFNRGREWGCILNARTAAVRTDTTAFILKRTRSGEMNVKSIAGRLGKDELALRYRLIRLNRWLTIGVCLTSSLSQSRV